MNSVLRLSSACLSGCLVLNLAMAGIARANPARFDNTAKICTGEWLGAAGGARDCAVDIFSVVTFSPLTKKSWPLKVAIRSGYLAENPSVPFRGNIIYYEGLADSMLNHAPLFNKLTLEGYRVIAFDYMGQGGSGGTMNDTRIVQIAELGNQVWRMYARDLEKFPKKTIIAWSTGGLAAYVQAGKKLDVDNLVLIAPGIVPNKIVGEQHPLRLKFNQITLASLTTQVYSVGIDNPHLDPIKPNSPLEVLDFALDLTNTASEHRKMVMSSRVNGFVLLSGNDDTYVNAYKTFLVLQKMAPHFIVKQYLGSLHEIDNEADPNRSQAHQDILDFLRVHM